MKVGALLARLLVGAVLGVVLLSCCLTGGWHECDSSTYAGGCRGNRFTYCAATGGSWSGSYEELVEADCGEGYVCVEPSPGLPTCAIAPGLPCDPETYVGRCDGDTPVICGSTHSWITDDYEVHGSPCTNGWHCRVDDRWATCVPP